MEVAILEHKKYVKETLKPLEWIKNFTCD
jgi:hypothetical protein